MCIPIDVLSHISVGRALTPSTAQRLAAAGEIVDYTPGTLLYHENDPIPGLFGLLSGYVKLYRRSKQRSQVLAVLVSGECFGVEAAVKETKSPYTAESITSVTSIYFPTDELQPLLSDCPDLRTALLELVSTQLRQLVTLVHSLAFREVAARIAMVLLHLAEVGGEQTDAGVCIRRFLTQQELAAMVGSVREVVHRILKQFEQDDLIRLTSTHILLLDCETLTTIANREAR